jgi:hypothetical protein
MGACGGYRWMRHLFWSCCCCINIIIFCLTYSVVIPLLHHCRPAGGSHGRHVAELGWTGAQHVQSSHYSSDKQEGSHNHRREATRFCEAVPVSSAGFLEDSSAGAPMGTEGPSTCDSVGIRGTDWAWRAPSLPMRSLQVMFAPNAPWPQSQGFGTSGACAHLAGQLQV